MENSHDAAGEQLAVVDDAGDGYELARERQMQEAVVA